MARKIYEDGEHRYKNWDDIAPQEMTSLTTAYFSDSRIEASFMVYYQDEVYWEQGDESEDHVRVDARVAKHWQVDNQKC